MLLSLDLFSLYQVQDFCMKKAIIIAKMINSQEPKIQFKLNDEFLMFSIKDKAPGSLILGRYYSPSGRADIYVDETSSHEKMMSTILHEFAHHLQWRSRFKSKGWKEGSNHPGQDALYAKYKELCQPYYAGYSPKEMAAEAFRLLMGWSESLDWELNQSFRKDWFDFFYSQESFSLCLGASVDESIATLFYSKLTEEMWADGRL